MMLHVSRDLFNWGRPFFLTVLFLLVGCNGFQKQLVTATCVPPAGVSRVDASVDYRNSVQPILFSNCKECHKSGGQAPSQFADSSRPFDTLYRDARLRLSVNNFADSLLVVRGTDGHCKGCEVASNKQIMLDAIEVWAASEKAALHQCEKGADSSINTGGSGKSFRYGAGIDIPADLPNTFQLMSVPLDDLGVTGVSATIEMRRYTDRSAVGPGSYEVKNLKIISAQALYLYQGSLRIAGTDGNFSNGDFEHINTGIPVFSFPGVFASSRTSVLIQQGVAGDKLQIGFTKIEAAQSACRDLTTFTANVEPIVQNTCMTCHDGTNANATARMSLSRMAAPQAHCEQLRARSTFAPLNSLIITRPQGDLNGAAIPAGRPQHPNISATYTPAQRNSVAAWIIKEMPQ